MAGGNGYAGWFGVKFSSKHAAIPNIFVKGYENELLGNCFSQCSEDRLIEWVGLFVGALGDGEVDHKNAKMLYDRYVPHHGCMDVNTFSRIFLDFDTWPQDHVISQAEFAAGWQTDGLNTHGETSFSFEIMDHSPRDNEITQQEITAIFNSLFQDGHGCIDDDRFVFVWSALFAETKD